MKRLVACMVLVLYALMTSAPSAYAAEDAITTAINTLQRTNAYIAPATDGTTSTSLSEIKQVLKEGDHVVVVMVPASGTAISQSEAANRILSSLKEPAILVLAYDRNVDAYSNRLPDTVTVDLINRAKSIARSPVEITTVFVNEVHKYQAAHPDPTPEPSTPSASTSPQSQPGFNWLILVVIVVAVVLVAETGVAIYTKIRDPYPVRHAPSLVGEKLHAIKRLMPQINDSRLVNDLARIVKDSGAFFKRAKDVSQSDIQGFARRLGTAIDLLTKYIDIQNEPEYAPVPPGADVLLDHGRIAIKGLSDSILKAIRDGNAGAVLDFQLKADLLSADIRRDYR